MTDGRNARKERTRERIIEATRALMMIGVFRPHADTICGQAGTSTRTIYEHFGTLENLYMAALNADVARAICFLLPVTDELELARVVILGRVTT